MVVCVSHHSQQSDSPNLAMGYTPLPRPPCTLDISAYELCELQEARLVWVTNSASRSIGVV